MPTSTNKPTSETKTPAAANQTDAKVEGGQVEGLSTTSPAEESDRKSTDSYAGGANPTVNEGDKLPPLGSLSGNVLPPEGTGFHCGICGQVIGKQGQHYDGDGEVTEVPHANVMVVADNWPDKQVEVDQQAMKELEDRRARRKADSEQ